eukprot:CAMPEP_0182907028 /NCGR_PEP_ID=MMETSP0034_2-20130328/34182_1 /TAXON_ID=156128 /ORGANISM="Nephroselmis pyriformis, Strain CCMP717" /LENGTH=57 /DNA_ID=CAMNT_0025042865 /DNA_START=1403 /DNA_END=1576 /DNA_ORIENTATION=-
MLFGTSGHPAPAPRSQLAAINIDRPASPSTDTPSTASRFHRIVRFASGNNVGILKWV